MPTARSQGSAHPSLRDLPSSALAAFMVKCYFRRLAQQNNTESWLTAEAQNRLRSFGVTWTLTRDDLAEADAILAERQAANDARFPPYDHRTRLRDLVGDGD